MRAKRRAHSLSRARVPAVEADLAALAARATYTPSPEHKDHYTSTSGISQLRTDATPCPRDVTREQAEAWLREAIVAGDVGGAWGDAFPRYAWKKVNGVVFEARLTNATQGWFKGYPLDPSEWPQWLS